MLEDVVARTGLAAALSTTIAITSNPRKPRYLLGAAIGIPIATLIPNTFPALTVPIAGAYLSGLAIYTLTPRVDDDIRTNLAITAGALGALGAGIARYL